MNRRILLTVMWVFVASAVISCKTSQGESVAASVIVDKGDSVSFSSGDTVFVIDKATLAVFTERPFGRKKIIDGLSSPSGLVSAFNIDAESATWRLDDIDLKVKLTVVDGTLMATFNSHTEQEFDWPTTFARDSQGLIIPDGEGLFIPNNDKFWSDYFITEHCYRGTDSLSFPAWGVHDEEGTLSFILHDGLYSNLCVRKTDSVLQIKNRFSFSERAGFPSYTVRISMSPANVLAPALAYRSYLKSSGEYVSLSEKQMKNSNVKKLFGAIHAYVWGTGRQQLFLSRAKELGIKRAVLNYDQNPSNDEYLVDRDYIEKAKQIGYLLGPYDTFANVQDPSTADNPASKWGADLWENGCIVGKDGKPVEGFGGRGCELSSEALKLASQPPNIASRVAHNLSDGANAYFLDVDAFGSFHDDYSIKHPMTKAQDRQNRLERMKYIIEEGTILGSEHNTSWSNPVTHYSHGGHTSGWSFFWPLLKSQQLGNWWPTQRPNIFFKKVTVSDEFKHGMFSPKYRIPLYQGVLHGSIVAVDRWELAVNKIPELTKSRLVTSLLYGVPTLWNFDLRELNESKDLLAHYYPVFNELHQAVGMLEVSDFQWLTSDRLVQRVNFGDAVTLTANFGSGAWNDLGPNCIEMNLDKGKTRKVACF